MNRRIEIALWICLVAMGAALSWPARSVKAQSGGDLSGNDKPSRKVKPATGRFFIPDSVKGEKIPMAWIRCYNGKEPGWCMPPETAVDWDAELKRPEVQKAVGNYVQTHCQTAARYEPTDSGTTSSALVTGKWTWPERLTCTQDTEPDTP